MASGFTCARCGQRIPYIDSGGRKIFHPPKDLTGIILCFRCAAAEKDRARGWREPAPRLTAAELEEIDALCMCTDLPLVARGMLYRAHVGTLLAEVRALRAALDEIANLLIFVENDPVTAPSVVRDAYVEARQALVADHPDAAKREGG
jgi:hypothetical protein